MPPESRFADRYRLTETLGRGGMGEVWKAYDERLNRWCAIKLLRQMQDGATAERFSREARTLASLRHPGVVDVYDYGVAADRPYLVMELLPGPSLAQLLREQGPLPIETVRRYGAQAADALQAVHDAGVIHRDIKPGNLVVDSSGSIRLVDFGIALGSSTDNPLTELGAIIGSASYLAPEQATGGRADARSDLYALGCLLMTLLTGKPPFDDDAPVEILGRHLNEAPVRPSDRRAQIPADLDQLVMDLLAKSPAQRPASAAEVAYRLSGGTRPRPGPVPLPVRSGPIDTRVSGTRAVTPAAAVGPGRGAPRRRRGLAPLGIAVVVALGAVTIGWALTRPQEGGTSIPFVPPTAEPTPSATATRPPRPTPSPSAPTPLAPLTPPPPQEFPRPTKPAVIPPIIPPIIPPAPTQEPTRTPEPEPTPTAELDALRDAVEQAAIAEASVKDDLRSRVAAIRAAAESGRSDDAVDLVDEFTEQVGELEGTGALDPDTATALRNAAADLRAALT
ncbi:MAG: serine/threonine-protein kinase [Sporichthyaceae bacterium]